MDLVNKCMAWCNHRYAQVGARVLIALLFIVVGGSKLLNFTSTAQFIDASGLPAATALTALAILFELGGGLMLLVGWKTRIAIPLLMVFTIVATALFHIKGLRTDQLQQIMFLKNLAILGGLMALYKGCGCGHGDCVSCQSGSCATCEAK